MFGLAVSVSGGTIVVGAVFSDDTEESCGAAYVFDASTGEQLHRLTADDASYYDFFGQSVSMSGNTIVVGAYGNDDSGSKSGSAYVFDATTGQQLHKLTADDAGKGDGFGISVSICHNTIVVGAYGGDGHQSKSGSAYIFDASTGEQIHKLTADDGAAGDKFGHSVSISGSLIVIGAWADGDAGAYSGSAYVFDASTGEQIHRLTADDAEEWAFFGISVSICHNTIVVGAYQDDAACTRSGSAYVFDASTGEQIHKLTADDAEELDFFGGSVAVSGNTIVVGAWGDDDAGHSSGSAYVFDASTGEQLHKLTADAAVGDNFGMGVSISGDFAVVGAPQVVGGGGFACVFRDSPPCHADIFEDGLVDVIDLTVVLARWGTTGPDGDIAGQDGVPDGIVDVHDLLAVLAAWGPCPIDIPGMVLIPGGEFEMGDHWGGGFSDELPVHDVYIDSFYMSIYETTNEQYCAYLNSAYGQGLIDNPDSHGGVVHKAGDIWPYCDTTTSSSNSRIEWDGSTFTVTPGKESHPILRVSWYGSVAYANWRSAQEGLQPSYDLDTWECNWDANGYRLPTEAEWEYAARGGEHDPYYKYPWGNSIDGSMANYSGSGDPYEIGSYPWTTPIGYYDGGQTPPGVDMANGYGLYDMTGNVWEWCNDWYSSSYYSSSPNNNPHGPPGPLTYRVLRGGAWYDLSAYQRCALRLRYYPVHRISGLGFRLALDS